MHADTAPDRYLVLGNPISHSKSPQIHTLFAAQTGQSMTYAALLVALGDFAAALKRLQADGVKGANVTVPFKQEAWAAMNTLSERADQAKAVNTIVFKNDGTLFGDNTDGVGLVADLTQNNAVALTGKRILMLGAGGAARGVINPLLAQRPTALVIANRTVERAQDIVADFAQPALLSACAFNELADQRFDVIINATSASLTGDLPPVPATVFDVDACAYDMMYGKEPTVFLRWAAQAGASKTLDGLGMLVEQAAAAFKIWRGVRPETAAVIAKLREN